MEYLVSDAVKNKTNKQSTVQHFRAIKSQNCCTVDKSARICRQYSTSRHQEPNVLYCRQLCVSVYCLCCACVALVLSASSRVVVPLLALVLLPVLVLVLGASTKALLKNHPKHHSNIIETSSSKHHPDIIRTSPTHHQDSTNK